MRKKEGLADYRYFPEPDLPPLRVSDADIDAARASMPELPSQLRSRLAAAGLPEDATLQLAEDSATAAYYDAAVTAGANPVQAANWILRDIVAWCKENGVCYHMHVAHACSIYVWQVVRGEADCYPHTSSRCVTPFPGFSCEWSWRPHS